MKYKVFQRLISDMEEKMEQLRRMVAILNVGVASESVTSLSPGLKRHGAGIIS